MKLTVRLLILLMLGSISPLIGQVDSLYVDSLQNVLRTGPDSSRLHTLMELAEHLKDARRRDSLSRQMGMDYAREATNLALSSQDQEIKEHALELMAFYYRRNDKRDSLDYIEELLNEFQYFEGYLIPDKAAHRQKRYPTKLRTQLQYWYDSTGTLGLEEVIAIDQFSSRHPKNPNEDEGAWWFRTKLISNADSWEDHTFYSGGTQSRWDSLKIYSLGLDSTWNEQITGNALPEDEWLVKDASNHFVLSIPPNSQELYYFRVRGSKTTLAPDGVELSHVNYSNFLKEEVKDRHVNGIFQGIVLIQLFFFLLLFLATKDRIYGYYALYITGLGLFILTVNYAGMWFGLSRETQVLLYILSVSLCVIGMLTFSFSYLNIEERMPGWKRTVKIFIPLFIIVGILFSISLIFFIREVSAGNFASIFTVLMVVFGLGYVVMLTAALIFLPIWGFRVYNQGYTPAKFYLLATAFLMLGVIVPIFLSFFTEQLTEAGYRLGDLNPTILEAGIALQLCLFALAVGHKRNLLEKERRAALENNLEIQQKINAATDRFVPYEFLRSLGRESILDVNLGDQVEKRVTLFFSDIRDYTTLSEQMTPQQNFIFLNQYLGRVGPVIKTNRGFVNQYYGDGLLALFLPNGTDEENVLSEQDAVKAALDMHSQVREYNEERIIKERDPIRIGIGIHTGSLMLGVIGDEKRMDVGVVSDTVNTTARLEGLTKRYGVTTIVSGQTFGGLTDPDAFKYRPLGEVMVKGRKTPIALYDFFDGDPGQRFDLKSASLKYFMDGYEAFFQRRFKDAAKLFKEVLKIFPNDLASQYFLTHAEHNAKNGVPDEWTGVEILTSK